MSGGGFMRAREHCIHHAQAAAAFDAPSGHSLSRQHGAVKGGCAFEGPHDARANSDDSKKGDSPAFQPYQNRIKTPSVGVLWVVREEQIPQVIGKAEKARNGMEPLEGNSTGPRHVWRLRSSWARHRRSASAEFHLKER
jgi:hypothetical protein